MGSKVKGGGKERPWNIFIFCYGSDFLGITLLSTFVFVKEGTRTGEMAWGVKRAALAEHS